MTQTYKTRYFNSIERVEGSGVLRKTSRDFDKLKAEYDYWYALPSAVSKYFVQPINFTSDSYVSSYDMEELPVANAAEQLVTGAMSNKSFSELFNQIQTYRDVAASYSRDPRVVSFFGSAIVLGKTAARVESLNNSIWRSSSHSVLLKMNGITPDDLLVELGEKYEKYSKVRKTKKVVLSHGDLTLSNILWDESNCSISLVDPKGIEYMYLDEYYDLAKLSQSLLGKYDYILYGKYDLTLKHCALEIYSSPEDQYKESVFKDYLEANDISLELLRVYEASLFLSMIPMHLEDLQRVAALLVNCKNILNSL